MFRDYKLLHVSNITVNEILIHTNGFTRKVTWVSFLLSVSVVFSQTEKGVTTEQKFICIRVLSKFNFAKQTTKQTNQM